MARPTTTREEATQDLGALSDRLEALARSDLPAAPGLLRQVVEAGGRSVHGLTSRLLGRAPREVLERALEGEGVSLPPGLVPRMAFAWALVVQLDGGQLDLRALLSRPVFRSAGVEGRWEELRGSLLAPLQLGVRRLSELLAALPGGPIELDAVWSAGLARLADEGPPTAAGTPTAAPVLAGPPLGEEEPSGALGHLRARVRALVPDRARQQDLLLDARILAVELEKLSPDPERLADLVGELAAADRDLLAPALASLLEAREGDRDGAREAFQDAPTRRMPPERRRPAPRTTRRAAKPDQAANEPTSPGKPASAGKTTRRRKKT